MSLFAELRQRKLVQWALAYAAAAFAVVQGVDIVATKFGWPESVARVVIIAAFVGFFATLILAWYHGERGAQRVAGTELLILSVLLAIGGALMWKFAPEAEGERGSKSLSGTQPDASTRQPASERDSDPLPPLPEASIAVLPFLNMSTDAENGFFADGISEEVLNVLAGIDGLTVASRTSAFSFKGKDTPIPEIARQLGVRHVLEGSVRKQGQRVRITAQLIKAGTDVHLWSQVYDRDLTDIFKMQEEIAQSIAIELEGILGKRHVAVKASTSSLAGYERFLSGRARFHQRKEFAEAIADLRYAVEQDPRFAEAWITLAAAQLSSPGYGAAGLTRVDVLPAVREALARAQALAPEHPMVLAMHGQLHIDAGDMVAVIEWLERAARASTQDSTPVMWLGQMLHLTGYTDEAIEALERAERMEPLLAINSGSLAMALLAAGQRERAEAKSAFAAARGWPTARRSFLWDLAASGQRARAVALAEADRASQAPGDRSDQARFDATMAAWRDPTQAHVDAYPAPARPGAAPEHLMALERGGGLLDWMLAGAREPTRREEVIGGFRTLWFPSTRAQREDPRFFAIADAVGFVRLWEARGYPPGCKRVVATGGDHLNCAGIPR